MLLLARSMGTGTGRGSAPQAIAGAGGDPPLRLPSCASSSLPQRARAPLCRAWVTAPGVLGDKGLLN